MLFNVKTTELLTIIIISSLINSILALDTCRDVIGRDCGYCGNINYPRQQYYLQNCMRSCRVCTKLNVALNKPTEQSSIYSDSRSGYDESLSRSSNAVDGYTDANWDDGHCTHTRIDRPSWWCVDLEHIYNNLYIRLFNRDRNKDRLRGFEIKFSVNGQCNQAGFTSATSCYKDTTPTPQDVYTIDRCNHPTSTSISARTVYVTVSSQVLTLCEVQIFSADQVQCNTGYYSTSSSTCQPCNTCYNDTCDPDTGACTGGCKDGYHGVKCEDQCSDGCLNSQCNGIDGSCACKDGYYGDYCEDQCSDGCLNSQCNEIDGTCVCKGGYYGDTCTSRCSPNCKDGKCSTTSSSSSPECTDGCIGGYKDSYCQSSCPGNCKTCQQYGSSCTNCLKGGYGDRCDKNCSRGCDGGCDRSTGRCATCLKGIYGYRCDMNCSIGCDDGCDRGTGRCTSCIKGKTGDRCDINCKTDCTVCNQDNTNACIECKDGRWGSSCSKLCSTNCKPVIGTTVGKCNITSGLCREGCKTGLYGIDCNIDCRSNCKDGLCDQITGNCIDGCLPGKIGSNCTTDCEAGSYGDNCTRQCGNCGNKTQCDVITGSCGPVGCADGFQGPTCHERVPVSTSAALSTMVYVVIGVVIGVLCGILGTVAVFLSYHFYKKRRQSTNRSPNEEIIPDYMYVPSHLNPSSSTTDDTLTTGFQNIPTNARSVENVNQSFNTGDTYDTLDHTSNDLKAPNTYASIDSNKHK